MDSVLYALIWFAIVLIAVTTMMFAGGWVLLPVSLVIILAFIAGKLREEWQPVRKVIYHGKTYEVWNVNSKGKLTLGERREGYYGLFIVHYGVKPEDVEVKVNE